jgi:purine-binding chemotaxis protein CheW
MDHEEKDGMKPILESPENLSLGGKYLTFFLDNEEYGIEILKVQEIIGIMEFTPVPQTPKHIKGVGNLRGRVIPIIDLGLKFDLDPVKQTVETCTIVVKTHGITTGIVVDRVSEVLDIREEDIEETPSFGSNANTGYILGIGKSEGGVKLLLDIDRVCDIAEAKEQLDEAA